MQHFKSYVIIAENNFYSARLYKAVSGSKITAVFCICPELIQYIKVWHINYF